MPIQSLADAQIKLRKPNAGDFHYGLKRGRAVWIPTSFVPKAKKYSLACYHRNLVYASLQTESLVSLMQLMTSALTAAPNTSRHASMETLVQSAAGILGRLYGGDTDIYRSGSVRRQIDDHPHKAAINDVRKYRGRPPL